MDRMVRTETVGNDGVLRLEVAGLEPGTVLVVTILPLGEEERPIADSNPDVEDFA